MKSDFLLQSWPCHRQSVLSAVAFTGVFNTVVAGLITVFLFDDFWHNLLISHLIGFSIVLWQYLIGYWAMKHELMPFWVIAVLGLTLGLLQAMALIWFWLAPAHPKLLDLSYPLFLGLVFGIMAILIVSSVMQYLRHQISVREAKIQALSAQIEPHFLFNTLANIEAYIQVDADKAQQMVQHLSQLLRQRLQQIETNQYTLDNELQAVEAYLHIQQLRLGDRLTVHWQVDDSCRSLTFPSLLLQPIVENAIVHGIDPAMNGGEIHVDVHGVAPRHLHIRITNTGKAYDATQPDGLALRNVRQRLAYEFAPGSTFSLTATPQGTCAHFHLWIHDDGSDTAAG